MVTTGEIAALLLRLRWPSPFLPSDAGSLAADAEGLAVDADCLAADAVSLAAAAASGAAPELL